MEHELEILRSRVGELEGELARERRERDLVQRISHKLELDDLLDTLCSEIETLGPFDGYLINLIDDTRENLVCWKLRLPESLAGMEETYHRFRFPLDLGEANADCFAQCQPIHVDQSNAAEFSEDVRLRFERWQMESLVYIPLCDRSLEGEVLAIGSVMLFRQHGAISPQLVEDIRQRLSLFACQVRNVLHFHSLKEREKDVRMAVEEEQRFLQFVSSINAINSVEQIYSSIATEFLRRYSFDVAGVFVHEGEQLLVRNCTAVSPRYQEVASSLLEYFRRNPLRLEVSEGAIVNVFMRNQHLIFRDVVEIMHLPMSAKDQAALRLMKTPHSFVMMPIRQAGEPVGVIWLISLARQVRLYDSQVKLIELLCSFIGSAMSNAETYSLVQDQKQEIEALNFSLSQRVEELHDLAIKDHLTGLNNLGFFEEELTRRMHEYRRNSTRNGLSLVIVDVDAFSEVNEGYGHMAGNLVLQEVARRIAALARKMDITCRYGGEEFAVVLPKCGIEGARHFAERLREEIAGAAIEVPAGRVSVTISAGCAEFIHSEDITSLINRADRALHSAKNLGRNCVEIAPENQLES